jgi:hypothetical protein
LAAARRAFFTSMRVWQLPRAMMFANDDILYFFV